MADVAASAVSFRLTPPTGALRKSRCLLPGLDGAMIQAQKIACTNHAGFVMSFVAQTKGARSISTGNYPINQTEVIDLGTSAFRPGLEFWPEVDAVLGRTIGSDDHIIFAMN